MHTPKQGAILTLIALPVITAVLLSANLPPIYYASIDPPRPPEVIAAVIFLVTLLIFIRKGNWRTDSYGHWLNMGVMAGLISQIFCMAFSKELFDASFTAAHILKIAGYICIAIGFMRAHQVSSSARETEIIKPKGLPLGAKLAILCGFIGFICVMPIAIKSSQTLHLIASENGMENLSAAAANSSAAIEEQRRRVDADLNYLAGIEAINSLYRADQNNGVDPIAGTTRKKIVGELSLRIQNLLLSDPNFFSIAYVDAVSGESIVRGEQSFNAGISVTDQQVLESSTRELATQALSGGSDQTLARSKIFLLQNDGVKDDQHPQIEGTALAVYSGETGTALGVFVLHSDVSRELTTTSLPDIETLLYVVNSDGQFVSHPDASKEVLAGGGTTYTLADEFPGLDFDALTADGMTHGTLYEQANGVEIIVGVEHLPAMEGVGDPLLYIYTGRRDDIEKRAAAIGFELQRIAQGTLLVAILIGWFFARRLAKPVQEISAAAVEFGRSGIVSKLPVDGRDEIGMLAKSLSDMMAAVSSQRSKLTQQAAAIERKSDELQRSNHDLEQFAYVASHDLKAPLRAIEVLVEWLKEDLEEFSEGDVQENLDLLVQRTSRLNRLLDDLLAYSRAGRKIGDVKELHIKDFVDDIVTLISPPEGFVIETEGDLPTIVTHHAPLETVFRNLISNAIKHSPVPEEGRIRIYAEDQGEKIMFAVEDNGAGIPEEYAEKVFKMFQTLKARDEMEGSGMGLAIVQRIIDWQGGRIWFHPGPDDKGITFKFLWNKTPQEMPEVESQDAPDTDEVTDEGTEDAPGMSDTQILMAG
jgi:signal transduction histidine kinase